jgi:hypothetical protein
VTDKFVIQYSGFMFHAAIPVPVLYGGQEPGARSSEVDSSYILQKISLFCYFTQIAFRILN